MSLRALTLSTLVIISGSMFAPNAIAESTCDGLMTNLINDQCGRAGCGASVVDGKIASPTVRNGDSTTLRTASKASDAGLGLEEVTLEQNGDKATLKMTLKDTKGRTAKTDYVFDSKTMGCALLESSTSAPGDLTSKVDYDRAFCEEVEQAYGKLSESEAKACGDAMAAMASAYDVRASALGAQKKVFRQSAPLDRFAPAMSTAAPKGSAGRALAQRNNCLATLAVMNDANPWMKKIRATNASAPVGAYKFLNTVANASYPLSETPQSSRVPSTGGSPVRK